MEAKQLYEFDKDLTGGIPIRQMIGTFDIYKLRWNKKRNDENGDRKKSIISVIGRYFLSARDPRIGPRFLKFTRYLSVPGSFWVRGSLL